MVLWCYLLWLGDRRWCYGVMVLWVGDGPWCYGVLVLRTDPSVTPPLADPTCR